MLDIIFTSNSVGDAEAENSDSYIEDGDLSPDDKEEPEDRSSDKDSENTDTEDPEQNDTLCSFISQISIYSLESRIAYSAWVYLHMSTCHAYSAYVYQHVYMTTCHV